jgi:TPR repeat protein
MSASGLLSDVSAKVLNSTEGAHLENMSTFEADEHLRAPTPPPNANVESAGRQSEVKRGRLRYMLWGSVLVRATKALAMLKSILAGVVLSLMLTGGAAAGPFEEGAAGPFEEGAAALKRGDYATALRLWRPLAEQGDALVQSLLGIMYAEGQGVPQDYAEAVKWYRLAAEQGDGDAQFLLGVMYARGEGVPQDYAEAVKWYRLAAEQGDALAQSNLGGAYRKGEGVPQDYAEAAKWYRLAAEQGLANAQYLLGFNYYLGVGGVPQDFVAAAKWYRLAAEQGLAGAQAHLGIMYMAGNGVPRDDVLAYMWSNLAASRFSASETKKHDLAVQVRDFVASKMTPAQLTEAQRLAREWKPAHAGAETQNSGKKHR